MFSQTAEYALRAMVVLAAGDGAPRTAQEIALEAQVPLDYLAKIMVALVRAGLVTSQRGRGGGFATARTPHTISVLDVVNAVDPLRRIRTCPLKLPGHGLNLCPLHRKLDDAIRLVEEALESTSLAQVAGAPIAGAAEAVKERSGGTLCHVQAAH